MLNCKGHIHAALHLFSLVVDGLTLFWGLPINPVGNIWEINKGQIISKAIFVGFMDRAELGQI